MTKQPRPYVVAGCPIRDRAWAIPDWVSAMRAQTRPPDLMIMLVEDSPADIAALEKCGFKPPHLTSDGYYFTLPAGEGGSQRIPGPNRYSMSNLARARNRLVDLIVELVPATHFWSCDSDIRPSPTTLEKLLAANKQVIGAPVRTSETVWTFMSDYRTGEPWRTGHEHLLMEHGQLTGRPFEASFVGACVLHDLGVFSSARYADHPRGEDLPFCMALFASFISIWLHPTAHTLHHMSRDRPPLSSDPSVFPCPV